MVLGIWRQALLGTYTLLISSAIVTELAQVLRSRFGWDEARIISRLKLLVRKAETVLPAMSLKVIRDDHDDDRNPENAQWKARRI